MLNQPWVRPALMSLVGIAALVKTLAPTHTIAHMIADQILTLSAPLAAGSIGASWDVNKNGADPSK